jgi:hypothetical protein
VPETAEEPPSADRLRQPRSGSPETFARRHEDQSDHRRIDHPYTDFARTAAPSRDITLSYGEYAEDVPSDFAALLARAEHLARAYDSSVEVAMREWRTTRADKTTDRPGLSSRRPICNRGRAQLKTRDDRPPK